MFHLSVRTELTNSMYNLLLQMPVTAISVQKITDHCGVSRRTFYHYFNDKYDLMSFLLYIKGEQLWYKNGRICSFEEYYERHIQFEHLPLQVFRNMYEYVGQNDLREFLVIKAARDLRRVFIYTGHEDMLERRELQDIINLLAYGLAAMFEQYVRDPGAGYVNLHATLKCFPKEYRRILLHKPSPEESLSLSHRFDPETCLWPPEDLHLHS